MTLADRLNACQSVVVHDAMKDLGLPLRVLPRTIVGLEPTTCAAGPVFTVRGPTPRWTSTARCTNVPACCHACQPVTW